LRSLAFEVRARTHATKEHTSQENSLAHGRYDRVVGAACAWGQTPAG
jgi:hypothetical protein